MKARGILGVLAVFVFLGSLSAEERVGGVIYEKLDTRAATEKQLRARLQPSPVEWGDWHLLSPFPYRGHGQDDLKTPHPPEEELSRYRAGGPGPDLSATYTGKKGIEVAWQNLGHVYDRRIDLHVHSDPQLNDMGICYLHTTVTATEDTTVDITMGSDDGLRFWLGETLLVDRDVPRGLNPEAEKLKLRLRRGVNHVLAKVSEGGGGWDYQMNVSRPLDPSVEAHIEYVLDRDFPGSPEAEYYRLITIPEPADVVLEVGGLDVLPDGRPAVTTRRGEVYVVDNAYDEPALDAVYRRFAQGLHEPLGLEVRDDEEGAALYTVQRGELTRLVDLDGDDVADVYETVSDGWGVSGNYHEFAFGPRFDQHGNAWVTLNVGFCGSLGKATVPWRGWALKITPEGEVVPVCCGLRSPNGFGMNRAGEMFYVDNQGDYVATNRLSWMSPGSWHGHPSSLRWRDDHRTADDAPPRQPASVWFPYRKMGQSAADVVMDDTGGKFGPFADQIFVGDQTLATVMRVTLEEVDGFWQGACYPFRKSFACGVNRMTFAPDGSMLVGMTDRGWGSVGGRRYGLQRLVWSGKVPFEIREMKIVPGGFELHFTRDVDRETAASPGSYHLKSYTYEYHIDYGCPELETADQKITGVEILDARRVRLTVDRVKVDFVHELRAAGVRSATGEKLLHDVAYYTVQKIPR